MIYNMVPSSEYCMHTESGSVYSYATLALSICPEPYKLTTVVVSLHVCSLLFPESRHVFPTCVPRISQLYTISSALNPL